MSKSVITDSLLVGIADAIRAKTGGEASLTPAEMITEIESISGGGEGGETPEELADLLIYKNFTNGDIISKYPSIVPLVDFGPVQIIPQSSFLYAGGSSTNGFGGDTNVEKIVCPNLVRIGVSGMKSTLSTLSTPEKALKEAYFPVCQIFSGSACENWVYIRTLVIGAAATIDSNAFGGCGKSLQENYGHLYINASVQSIENRAFSAARFSEVRFTGSGTPGSISSGAFYSGKISDIYVPWSEGAVAGAPWGATTATIHYDTYSGAPTEGE